MSSSGPRFSPRATIPLQSSRGSSAMLVNPSQPLVPLRGAGYTAHGSAGAPMHPPARRSGSSCRLAPWAEPDRGYGTGKQAFAGGCVLIDGGGRLSGVGRPGVGAPREHRIPPPTGQATGQPLIERDGPLPTSGVEVSSAKGAACRVRCDSLAALRAISGMHNGEDPVGPSQAAKGSRLNC
jgi:hypothetical protein